MSQSLYEINEQLLSLTDEESGEITDWRQSYEYQKERN